jgi:hypothetical protein
LRLGLKVDGHLLVAVEETLERFVERAAPVLFLADKAGNLQGAVDGRTLSPALIWLSANQWPAGETIVVTFNKLNWDTRLQKAYRLGIGVSTASDPWNVGARWMPVVQQSPYANRLLSERTVLELAQLKRVAGMSEGGPSARMMRPPVANYRLNVIFSAFSGQPATVNPQARLAGCNIPQSVDGVLHLDLLWQGEGKTRGDYTRFVHVIGADGKLLGQWDSPPDGGTYPTFLWAEGEYVQDSVTIPLNKIPSGAYTLYIGLYNPLDGERLLTERGQNYMEISVEVEN